MPILARAVTAALCLALACASPAFSKSFQGSISPPAVSADGATVTAQISVTPQCAASEYCGYFPEVTTVTGGQPCAQTINGSEWIGDLVGGLSGPTPTTATATWSEYPTLYSGSKRACLYVMSDGVLVAQADYVVRAPPPPAAPAQAVVPPPTITQPAVQPAPAATTAAPLYLGYSEAVGVTRRWMHKTYRRRWDAGRRRMVKCPVRSNAVQVGCYAAWVYKKRVYSKTIVITEDDSGYTISKNFASAPTPALPTPTVPPATPSVPAPSAPADPGDFCSTHTCIPNFPNGTGAIVQCADGTYSHSGGKQGACSHHGGVSRAHVANAISRGQQSDQALRAFSQAGRQRARLVVRRRRR